ncbi:MAG: aldehyde dehydrogenase family protein [Thermoflexales bacterium]|nr:aldehyde dehydrogenase family protein [Thermoflexales bacterium]MDW8350361.1 aldehyde dehydrogenase family protein [Anaerolineae bacterium]
MLHPLPYGAQLHPTTLAFLRDQPKRLWIGGRWVTAAAGRTFDKDDPATGLVFATVCEADAEDVDRAVAAAREIFDNPRHPWRRMTPHDRERLLHRLADLIEADRQTLAQLITLENGKPLTAAEGEVASSVRMFRYYAGWPTKIEGDVKPVSIPDRLNYTLREPVGVVGAIIPWNFPLSMIAWKLAPALAAGNCVILKPAEQTPLTAVRVCELAQEAGFPDGVIQLVIGFGETAGAALTAHPGVDKIAFTGSTEVGKIIMRAAAGNLKRLSLELGGKSPQIILDDADVSKAVIGAAYGIFSNAGQSCNAGARLFVHRRVYDEVMAGLAERAAAIKVGPGLQAGVEMGPLVSREQLARVQGYVAAGLEQGARLRTGGTRPPQAPEGGYFLAPTVFEDVRDDMTIMREEIFGPVLAASPFDSIEEVAARANNTPYGLAAGIWTRDVSKAHRLAGLLRAGTVWVNCYSQFDPASPFGGYKQSGFGREMGHEALELYTQVKSVWIGL